MPFVIDASIATSWCLDERNPIADFALDRIAAKNIPHAPLLFWFELRNAVLSGVRQKRVTAERGMQMLDRVDSMPITLAPFADGQIIMDVAIRHRLTFYDASYLELAMRSAMPLATLDAALARAAEAEHIPLMTP